MFSNCAAQAMRGTGSFNGFGDNAPTGTAAQGYYTAGTKFDWLVPSADYYQFLNPLTGSEQRRAALAAALAGLGYAVQVVYGAGGTLEVIGSQGIDRGSGLDIRNEIIQAAQNAGFTLKSPVQFNVENAGTNWQVGTTGSQTVWGDNTPVAPQSIFSELGVDLSGDSSLAGGTIKNVLIVGGLGLLAFVLLTRK